VPEHWQIKPLLAVARERCESNEGMIESNLLSLSYGRIVPKDIEANDGLLPESFETYQLVHPGDIVFRLTDLQNDKRSLRTAIATERGIITSAYLVAQPAEMMAEYLAALLRAYDVAKVFYSMGGGLRQSMKFSDLKRLPVLVPPAEEQAEIIAFLAVETVRIDNLVAEQQRLIELLKEKRQAIISHAVTKGLNPETPMKPSGVEWLEDIPAHWSVKRLKHISPFITVGIVVNPSLYIAEEGLPFIYGGDIREGAIDWENARRISESASSCNQKTKLRSGDLVTVRVGAPGITAVVPSECAGGNCASVMLIRQGPFNSNWLCYAMNTRIVRFQVEVVQYGAAQEQFNISHAVNFWVPEPPHSEQEQIAVYLARETTKVDRLVAEAERAIELLLERRSALISAAVTGKIDVRQSAMEPVA
jgi:type I restriction enzyme S subunit